MSLIVSFVRLGKIFSSLTKETYVRVNLFFVMLSVIPFVLSTKMTDTLPIPGVGHYRAMYHVVVMNYLHLGEIKENFIF